MDNEALSYLYNQLEYDHGRLVAAKAQLTKATTDTSVDLHNTVPDLMQQMDSFAKFSGAEMTAQDLVQALGIDQSQKLVGYLNRPPNYSSAAAISEIVEKAQVDNFGAVPELQKLRNAVSFAMSPAFHPGPRPEGADLAFSNASFRRQPTVTKAKPRSTVESHNFAPAQKTMWRNLVMHSLQHGKRSEKNIEKHLTPLTIDVQLLALEQVGVSPVELKVFQRLASHVLKDKADYMLSPGEPAPSESEHARMMRNAGDMLQKAKAKVSSMTNISKGLKTYSAGALSAVKELLTHGLPRPPSKKELHEKDVAERKKAKDEARKEREKKKRLASEAREEAREQRRALAEKNREERLANQLSPEQKYEACVARKAVQAEDHCRSTFLPTEDQEKDKKQAKELKRADAKELEEHTRESMAKTRSEAEKVRDADDFFARLMSKYGGNQSKMQEEQEALLSTIQSMGDDDPGRAAAEKRLQEVTDMIETRAAGDDAKMLEEIGMDDEDEEIEYDSEDDDDIIMQEDGYTAQDDEDDKCEQIAGWCKDKYPNDEDCYDELTASTKLRAKMAEETEVPVTHDIDYCIGPPYDSEGNTLDDEEEDDEDWREPNPTEEDDDIELDEGADPENLEDLSDVEMDKDADSDLPPDLVDMIRGRTAQGEALDAAKKTLTESLQKSVGQRKVDDSEAMLAELESRRTQAGGYNDQVAALSDPDLKQHLADKELEMGGEAVEAAMAAATQESTGVDWDSIGSLPVSEKKAMYRQLDEKTLINLLLMIDRQEIDEETRQEDEMEAGMEIERMDRPPSVFGRLLRAMKGAGED